MNRLFISFIIIVSIVSNIYSQIDITLFELHLTEEEKSSVEDELKKLELLFEGYSKLKDSELWDDIVETTKEIGEKIKGVPPVIMTELNAANERVRIGREKRAKEELERQKIREERNKKPSPPIRHSVKSTNNIQDNSKSKIETTQKDSKKSEPQIKKKRQKKKKLRYLIEEETNREVVTESHSKLYRIKKYELTRPYTWNKVIPAYTNLEVDSEMLKLIGVFDLNEYISTLKNKRVTTGKDAIISDEDFKNINKYYVRIMECLDCEFANSCEPCKYLRKYHQELLDK